MVQNKRPTVLILGGGGMLGHKACQSFSREFDTWVTFRSFDEQLKKTGLFDQSKIIDKVDVFTIGSVENAIIQSKPDFVLNCVGIIKQLKDASDSRLSIYVNALFPHLLADLCREHNVRLIHFSTDCVFSGNSGMYAESDPSDAGDLYGRSKYLGETCYDHCLTLRTSIIGHELFTSISLVDWFISQKGKAINGFRNAIYTGFPTSVFSKELIRIIREFPGLSGLYHLSSERISKFDLLTMIREVYGLDIEINPDETFMCDRSLDSSLYRSKTNFTPLPWSEMVMEMFRDYKEDKILLNL
jgi:dTDP-4-dehydrorhamnose reductase